MFGNALFNPSNAPHTPGRRHSHLDVSLAPKVSQRRATSPVINLEGMSPGLGYMNGPTTPCFVTPTLGGFSGRRFSYDSPLQTFTALSSGGLPTLNRKAAKRAWATVNSKKWSKPFKMVMIMLLTSFAVTLFLLRKSKESSVPVEMRHVNPPPCNEHAGTCDALDAHQHGNPKEEFLGMVNQAEHFHELEEESNLWPNRWTAQDPNTNEETSGSQNSGTSDDSQVNVVEQEPIGLDEFPSKVMGYVESVKTFIGDKITGSEDNDGSEVQEDPIPVQDAALEVPVEQSVINPSHAHVLNGATSWHGNDHSHVVWPNQGFAQVPQANMPGPPQPAHIQQPQVGQSQLLHSHGQAPAPQQQYPNQGIPLQPAGHLRPRQPQVIGVPAHHMPQQQYAHPMPNAGQPLPPGVNPLRYNQYSQPHYNQNQGNIIGHNPQHHQNRWGQKLPPGVNPNHYRGL